MVGNRNVYMAGAGFGALVGGARGFAFGGDPISGAVAGAGFGAGVAARRDILTMGGEEGVVARGVLRGMGGGGGYGHGGYGHGGYTPMYRPVMYGGGQPIIIDRSPPSWGGGGYRGYGYGGEYGATRYAAPQMPSDISGIIANLARTFLGGERAGPPAGSPVYVPQGRYREIQGYAPSPATAYAQNQQQSAQPQQQPALRVQGAEDVTLPLQSQEPKDLPLRVRYEGKTDKPRKIEDIIGIQPLGAYPMCLDPAISTNVPLAKDFQAAAAGETPAGPSRLQEFAAGKEHGRFDQETYAKALKSLPAGPSPS